MNREAGSFVNSAASYLYFVHHHMNHCYMLWFIISSLIPQTQRIPPTLENIHGVSIGKLLFSLKSQLVAMSIAGADMNFTLFSGQSRIFQTGVGGVRVRGNANHGV